jgi:hypothetical protein
VAAEVFRESPSQIERGANVKFACRLTLEDVYGWHGRNMVGTRRLELLTFPAQPGRSLIESKYGRHEETRTPDLPGAAGTLSLIESKYGRHEETRTPDLYRVKVAL